MRWKEVLLVGNLRITLRRSGCWFFKGILVNSTKMEILLRRALHGKSVRFSSRDTLYRKVCSKLHTTGEKFVKNVDGVRIDLFTIVPSLEYLKCVVVV